MSNLYVLEAVNLFCGDDDPSKSKYLSLTSMTLPTLEEMTSEHLPGGSMMQLNIGMGAINALEAGFNLAGYDPDLLSLFGLGSRKREVFTAYGVIRDKRSSEEIEVKSIMHGRLSKVEADEFTRGELSGYAYSITEIVHYETYFRGKEKHFIDFFTQAWRVDGVSQNAKQNRILRIPGA